MKLMANRLHWPEHVTPFSRSWGSRQLRGNWGLGLYIIICTAYCMKNDVYLYCLLYSHHYAKFGLFTRERNLLMSPRHPYSCTEEVTSKGTVIHWLCSTAMSVNMLVQMRECPPDMCLTELLPGEKGTWKKNDSKPFRPASGSQDTQANE